MSSVEVGKHGAQQLRGTITQLRRKLTAAQAELAAVRDVIRAARKYLATGRDQELRQVMADVGYEEPPRKAKPRPQPTPPELPKEGPPFRPNDGFELL